MSGDLAAKAAAHFALLQPSNPVVVPTVWDARSARLASTSMHLLGRWS